ncbi:breast cancer type 1 susceptibility protein isoform X2 [Heterocephalus glaber]|uniref:Breast cancer type 1 susceptibility protein homolog n=1 Tax=Heterocephalus glaber TaxID=10181 RepID=A0AAX6RH97_HETGA|nr:breast cancer type 1 susceptibility protein isoform X2 [Heterocephalus glaber]
MEQKEMDLSTVHVEEVQNVLNAMQKILECPICLELIREPVSTKCDHIFCKFCMLKLLDQKKGPSQCPLCKNSITKRSLQESTRFSQLVEELLKVIRAFELDSGLQVANSYNFSKKEINSPEHGQEEIPLIQSMGYRNRARGLRQGEPEKPSLETSLGVQLSDLGIVRSLRTKKQAQPQNKSVYIELGSDSSEDASEDVANRADDHSVRDQDLLFSLQGTRAKASSHPAKQGNTPCEASEKGTVDSDRPHLSGEDEKPVEKRAAKRRPGKQQVGPAPDLRVEPCGTDTRASSLQCRNSRLLLTEDRMDVEKAEFCNKSKQPGFARSQQSRWAGSEESSDDGQTPSTEQKAEPTAAALCERRGKEQKPPCSETLGEAQDVYWVTLNSRIQKVNEWFSRSDKVVASDDACDRELEADAEEASALEDPKGQGGFSGSLEKIAMLTNSPQSALFCANKRVCPKAGRNDMKDKVFGKTYRRKPSLPSFTYVAENLTVGALVVKPQVTQEFPPTNKLKRKRRSMSCLHPEDFIKRADLPVAPKTPEKINQGTEQMEESGQVTGTPRKSHKGDAEGAGVQRQRKPSPAQSLEKESAARAEPQSCSISNMGLESHARHSEPPKKSRLRRRSSTRHVPHPSPLDHTELQIDNSTSTEEVKEKSSHQVLIGYSQNLYLAGEGEASIGIPESKKPAEQVRNRPAEEAVPEPALANTPGSSANSSGPDKELVNPSPQRDKTEENPETVQVSDNTRDPKGPVLSGERGLQTERSAESTSISLVPDTDYSTQDSFSLLEANSLRKAQRASHQCVTQYVAVAKPKELPAHSEDTGNDTEGFNDPLRRKVSHVQEANVEMEDSELDTQYLQNTFQASKRQSFALFSNPGNPEKKSTGVCAHSEFFQKRNPEVTPECEQRENSKGKKASKIRHVQVVNATASVPVISQNDQLGVGVQCGVTGVSKLRPSSQVRGYKTELVAADKHGISRNPCHVASVSRIGTSVKTACKKSLSMSPKEAVESERVLQSMVSTGCCKNSRDLAPKEASSGSGSGVGSGTNEVASSNEHMQAEWGRSRGPTLNAVLRSGLMQPKVQEQSLPVGDYKCPKIPQRGASGVVAQAVHADFSPCLIFDSVEQPMGSNPASQICSETPDDLLDEEDRKEDASFAEDDIKETSAVFSKSVQRRQFSRSPSPFTHTALARGHQRRVRKLESSEENMSSEDEELPCFQHLIFGKGCTTPQSTRPSTGATERVSKGTEENVVSLKDNLRGCTSEPVSPEPRLGEDIRCSGSLFSSQCSISEESAANTISQDPLLMLHPPAEQNGHPSGIQGASLSDKEVVSDDEDREPSLEEGSHHGGQSVDSPLGEAASGYESETNPSGGFSGLSSQSSILTTQACHSVTLVLQQKDTIQDNLLRLQQEMAQLEAVLERHGSQCSNSSTSIVPDSCPAEDLATLGRYIPGKAGFTSGRSNAYPVTQSLQACPSSKHQVSPDCPASENKEPGAGRSSPPEAQVADSQWSAHSQPRRLRDRGCPAPEQLEEEEELGESGPHHATALAHLPRRELVAEPAGTPAAAQTSNPARGASKEEAVSREEPESLSSVGGGRRRLSMVVSGLTTKESVLVQKFARKHHIGLTSLITAETTHVVMKTDPEFVCERTLKYFLGIAGGKWVVSYFWVTQSMQERRMLDECDFEVRGDVINGRSHQGPKRARESQDRKIFGGLTVCCCGPFTNMATDQLEWMLRLCGASVVGELSALPLSTGAQSVVVMQPEAWTEDADFLALGQLCQVPVVTRDWVLDSVALHQRQELDAYLIPQDPHRPR